MPRGPYLRSSISELAHTAKSYHNLKICYSGQPAVRQYTQLVTRPCTAKKKTLKSATAEKKLVVPWVDKVEKLPWRFFFFALSLGCQGTLRQNRSLKSLFTHGKMTFFIGPVVQDEIDPDIDMQSRSQSNEAKSLIGLISQEIGS